MTEIVPCRMCKGREDVRTPQVWQMGNNKFVACGTLNCRCRGSERPTEAEALAAWNELMQPGKQRTPDPKAGTVRVPVAVSLSPDDTTIIANDGTMWWLDCYNEWHPLPPLPQPATVEASGDTPA